jgi:hypothetical protein
MLSSKKGQGISGVKKRFTETSHVAMTKNPETTAAQA